jgi:hypothetical protein
VGGLGDKGWTITESRIFINETNRLKALRSKKERLGYAVERLTLQSQQRQRQLRMSVAGVAAVKD